MLILGKHCPDNKSLIFSLQSVFGVNTVTALKICSMVGVHRNVLLHRLYKAGKIEKLSRLCRDHLSAGVERQIKRDIKHLLEIKHYRGTRHMFALPARGQRTRTNASTAQRHAVIKKKKKGSSRAKKHGAAQKMGG